MKDIRISEDMSSNKFSTDNMNIILKSMEKYIGTQQLSKLLGYIRENNKSSKDVFFVIAGGCIRSALSEEPINDIDIFPIAINSSLTKDEINYIIDSISGQISLHMGETADPSGFESSRTIISLDGNGLSKSLAVVNEIKIESYRLDTSNTIKICFKSNYGYEESKIQFIKRNYFNSILDLLSSFDFTTCASAIYYISDGSQNSMIYGDKIKFFNAILDKELIFQETDKSYEYFSLKTLGRVYKFIKRGYKIKIESMVSVLNASTEALEFINSHYISMDSKRLDDITMEYITQDGFMKLESFS